MKQLRSVAVFLCAGALAMGISALPALSQTPNHVHYAKPPAEADRPSPSGALAPRLLNLGTHTFPVTTKSKDAQTFINQGVNLLFAFNHMEAARSFREAARLDPDCAMAYWGQSIALGPNINKPMDPNDEPAAYELAQKAFAMKAKASPREQAYIEALTARYSGKTGERVERDAAYSDAMRRAAARFPDDLDLQSFFAESMMDLRPWGYWTPDGSPYPGTLEMVATLEKILARDPNHPGATHYYIHAMELPQPQRAEESADRLAKLMPGAGHMVHMPAHIYYRVGRYADAAEANVRAIASDESYIAECQAQGIYPLAYYPHNVHFLWAASEMQGRSAVAIEAARKAASRVDAPTMKAVPLLQAFAAVPYFALVRFAKWDEMLKEPAPAVDSGYLNGLWHYARGRAFLGKGQLEEAEKELEIVRKLAADPEVAKMPTFSTNKVGRILPIAPEMLAGEIAAKRKQYDVAIAALSRAVRLNDAMDYTEPPLWAYPARHSLGAVLLEAGRPAEAEAVYWEDLRHNPENGWALFGLWQSLKAQGKTVDANLVEKRFEKAWKDADVKLTASRF